MPGKRQMLLILIENHAGPVALNLIRQNFVSIHKTLRISMAVPPGMSDHVLRREEIAALPN
jgi:hypothetical protein